MGLLGKLLTGKQSVNTAVTPQQARQMMDESNKYVLLDVRTHEEYKKGHIKGAKLIPVNELDFRAAAELPDKHTPVLVYCNSGARAAVAVKTLTKIGYTNALSFGGIANWPYETVKE